MIVTALATGAMALLWLGQLDEAEQWLERARRTLRPDGEPGTELIVDYARASAVPRAAARSRRRSRRSAPPNGWRICWPASTRSRLPCGRAWSRRRHEWASWRPRARAIAEISEAGARPSPRCAWPPPSIHLAEGDPEQAIDGARPRAIDGSAPAIHRPSMVTEAQLLDAVAREQLGDQRAAEASLEARARARRAGGRPVLPFILVPVRRLLERLPGHRTAHPTLRRDHSRRARRFRAARAARQAAACARSSARPSCASSGTCRPTSRRRRSPPSCSCRRTRSARTCATSTPSSTPTVAPRRSPAPGSSDCSHHRLACARRRIIQTA